MVKTFKENSITYIIGLDSESNILWDWERVPKIIFEAENSSNQVDIIVMKKDYRYGKYIKNTLEEILKEMKPNE